MSNRSAIIERGPSRSFFFSDPNNIVFEVATRSKGQRFPIHEDPDPAYEQVIGSRQKEDR